MLELVMELVTFDGTITITGSNCCVFRNTDADGTLGLKLILIKRLVILLVSTVGTVGGTSYCW